jgi:glycosyltransferase involved in cell wall biosynthesis
MLSDMKNVLLVGPFPPHQRGGGENAAYSLARAIKKRGFNVFVLSMGKGKFFEEYEDGGIRFYRIDKFYENRRYRFSLFHVFRYLTIELFNPFIFIFTIYLILKHKIDVVHLSTFHQISFSPLIAAKLLYRRTLITFHSHELFCFFSSLLPVCHGIRKGKCGLCMLNVHKFPEILKKYNVIYKIAIATANYLIKYILFLNLKAAHLADYIIFPSNYLRNFYIRYGFRENNTKVIYNFLNDFKSNTEDIKRLKKSFGIKNEIVILFVGNLIEAKGPHVLLDAFNLLKRKKNLRLIFVGGGPLLEELKKKASKLKLNEHIVFTGWIPNRDVAAMYNLSDVVVIPSLFPETFSLVFLEAFSAGKLVIASDIGALSENIIDGKNGFLVKPNDAKKFAEKLNYVIINLRKLEPVRKRAYQDAISKYNPNIFLKEYEGLYS